MADDDADAKADWSEGNSHIFNGQYILLIIHYCYCF